MKNKLVIESGIIITNILANVSGVGAYSDNGSTNMSGVAIIVLFVPIMLGIIYLASKGEVK